MKPTPRSLLLATATVALLGLFAALDTRDQPRDLHAAPEVTPLDRVPADASVFAHFRAADLWNHPFFNDLRKELGKDLEAYLAEAIKVVGIGPADLDTITFHWSRFPENPDDARLFVVQVTTKKPFDKTKILTEVRAKKDAVQKDGSVKLEEAMVLLFPGDKQFTVTHESLVAEYKKGASTVKTGPMADALNIARAGKANLVASLNPETLPADIFANAPAEVQPFLPLLKSKAITFHAGLTKELTAEVRFQADTADKAAENERAFNLLLKLATDSIDEVLKNDKDKSKEAQAFAPFLKDLLGRLKEVKATKDGNTVTANLTLKADPLLAKPIVQLFVRPQQAAARVQSANNMKQMGIALHNAADSNNSVFPAASICDKKGKPLLSWRVAILPYIEQEALYKQFKLDEPWDSEHNLKLAKVLVKVYQLPGSDAKPGYTNYRAFVGPDTAFDYVQGRRLPADFPDGTSNTILVCESADAVLWTKPDELEFDPKKPIKPLLRWGPGDVCQFLFADGSVRAVTKMVSETTLSRIIQRNDGQVIGNDLD